MKTSNNNGFNQIWKRNAVAGAITLFVCMAVYLNWSYEQETQAGKMLGEATMVGGESSDPLLSEETSGTEENLAVDVTENQSSNDYYATARLNRQQARDTALSLLQDAVSGSDADQVMLDQANEAIQTMADFTVTEAQIENLVVAKGYVDCVAFMGEESITIAVSASEGGITETDTARIVDVVNQTAGYLTSQIKIIEVE